VRFAFIARHRHIWPVSWLCEVLEVSRSGFHAWLSRPVDVSDLSAGYRLGWGRTVGLDLTAPLTGRPCVWWKVQVWESVREVRSRVGPDSTQWVWRVRKPRRSPPRRPRGLPFPAPRRR
jgi:hypothetical protein